MELGSYPGDGDVMNCVVGVDDVGCGEVSTVLVVTGTLVVVVVLVMVVVVVAAVKEKALVRTGFPLQLFKWQ